MPTPNYSIPQLLGGQAQKFVTTNEAFRVIDTALNLTVIRADFTAPPASPAEGDKYIVASPATGLWTGNENNVAAFVNGTWLFFLRQEGWRAYDQNTNTLLVWDGTSWTDFGGALVASAASSGNLLLLGVNAVPDSTNRLSVTSPAVLFNRETDDIRVNLNKAATGDNATFLFQTGFSGRAEIGLAGNDNFEFKTSPDGTTFTTSLSLNNADGEVDILGSRAYRRANIIGTASQSGGTPTGAIVERGGNANGEYVRFADGTQICWDNNFSTASGAAATWTFPAGFSTADTSPAINAVSRFTGGARIIGALNNAAGAVSANIYSWDDTGSDAVAPEASLMAVGRWF